MAKTFCADHADKKGRKPSCCNCGNLKDGSHAAMIEAGLVKKSRASTRLKEITHAIENIDRNDEQYF